jgi:protein regulator of cytokinesis 1
MDQFGFNNKSTATEASTSSPLMMTGAPGGLNVSTTSIFSPTPTLLQRTMTPGSLSGTKLNPHNRSHLSAFSPVHPILTPRETPRGSQGLVLLSPSRTITESLNSLASSTANQLEKIWDEVGYTPQERASQLSDLLIKFRDQCESKISEEQGVAETFRQTIADAKQEIATLSNSLKALVDPKLLRSQEQQQQDGYGDSMTLTDELANLEATLEGLRADAEVAKNDLQKGLDYLIESHHALGRKLDDTWMDIDSDLTAERRAKFHDKVEEMKHEVTTRTTAVIQLLQDCQHLMNDLGINSQGEDASDLDRRIAGSLVRSKDSSYMLTSKFESDNCTGISSKALEALSSRASELSNEKRRRKSTLQEMGTQIAMLWEQLRIPQEEQREFTESVKGLGMDTIYKGQAELKRLKSLKSGMLGKLVAEARDRIAELWEETNATEKHKSSFAAMGVRDEDMFDDDLLDQHDEYIKILEDRLEKMKPINRIIERREDILRERVEYEDLQKDSDRLKQRGAAMAKQLMEEEKMARRIKKELPKLTALLNEKLVEWKETHQEDFQFHGQIYSETMVRQDEEWLEYKQNELQLKLRKKQDDQVLEENKYPGGPLGGYGKKTNPTRAFGEGMSSRLQNSTNTRQETYARNTSDQQKILRTVDAGTSRVRTFTS